MTDEELSLIDNFQKILNYARAWEELSPHLIPIAIYLETASRKCDDKFRIDCKTLVDIIFKVKGGV